MTTIREKYFVDEKDGFLIHKESERVLFASDFNDQYFEKNLEFFHRFLNSDYNELILVKEKNDFFSLISIDRQLQIPLPVFLGWMDIPLENILDCHSGGAIIVWREDEDKDYTSDNTRYRS